MQTKFFRLNYSFIVKSDFRTKSRDEKSLSFFEIIDDNNNNFFNSILYYLRAESTAVRPITDTAWCTCR
jgi:hypothetical protein